MSWYPTVVLWIGITDGITILLLGVIAAILYMFNVKADLFYDRVLPACGILVGTSIASGIVMGITKWVVGFLV